MPDNNNQTDPDAPARKKHIVKNWRSMPIFDMLVFARVLDWDDIAGDPSAWDDFPENGVGQHIDKPQMSLAALFWRQDLSQVPKYGLMAGTAPLMELVNRENRLPTIGGFRMPMRLMSSKEKGNLRAFITRHYQIGENSTLSDLAALWAIRYSFSWPSPVALELALNKDESIRDVNSERLSQSLSRAISMMAWQSAEDPAEARFFYDRACKKIPTWKAPPLLDPGQITARQMEPAIDFLAVAGSRDLQNRVMIAITEIAIADKKVTQAEYECLCIFNYSLAMHK